MTKDEDLSYWIEIFRKNSIIQAGTNNTGDYKKGNQCYEKMFQAFEEIKKLDYPEYNHYVALLDDDEVSVQVNAAWDLLDTKHQLKAKKTLKNISKSGLPMLGLDAESKLNVWNEKNSWWAKMKALF